MKTRWFFTLFVSAFLLVFFASASQAQPAKDGFFLALKYDRENVSAMVGDGVAWRVLKQIPRADLGGPPNIFRVGKMSLQADNRDHATPGEMGSCKIEKISARGITNPNYSAQFQSEAINPLLTLAPLKLAQSPRPETKIEWVEGTVSITAAANSAAFVEWLITPQIMDEATFSCRVWKATDRGESWGPGLALLWPNGQFLVLNSRLFGQWSVTTREGETLIKD